MYLPNIDFSNGFSQYLLLKCCVQERGYLDTIFTAIGAVLGFQNCSEVMETICSG